MAMFIAGCIVKTESPSNASPGRGSSIGIIQAGDDSHGWAQERGVYGSAPVVLRPSATFNTAVATLN